MAFVVFHRGRLDGGLMRDPGEKGKQHVYESDYARHIYLRTGMIDLSGRSIFVLDKSVRLEACRGK
jgi:hypothetical protein